MIYYNHEFMRVENMLYIEKGEYYEVAVEEENPRLIFLSYLFSTEDEKIKTEKVKEDFMTYMGLSKTVEPSDEVVNLILENL